MSLSISSGIKNVYNSLWELSPNENSFYYRLGLSKIFGNALNHGGLSLVGRGVFFGVSYGASCLIGSSLVSTVAISTIFAIRSVFKIGFSAGAHNHSIKIKALNLKINYEKFQKIKSAFELEKVKFQGLSESERNDPKRKLEFEKKEASFLESKNEISMQMKKYRAFINYKVLTNLYELTIFRLQKSNSNFNTLLNSPDKTSLPVRFALGLQTFESRCSKLITLPNLIYYIFGVFDQTPDFIFHILLNIDILIDSAYLIEVLLVLVDFKSFVFPIIPISILAGTLVYRLVAFYKAGIFDLAIPRYFNDKENPEIGTNTAYGFFKEVYDRLAELFNFIIDSVKWLINFVTDFKSYRESLKQNGVELVKDLQHLKGCFIPNSSKMKAKEN